MPETKMPLESVPSIASQVRLSVAGDVAAGASIAASATLPPLAVKFGPEVVPIESCRFVSANVRSAAFETSAVPSPLRSSDTVLCVRSKCAVVTVR